MLCILYVNVVCAILGGAALLIERAIPAAWPRRWLWCGAIALAIAIPPVYQARHTWSVVEALEKHAVHPPQGQALEPASFSALDPAWWSRTRSFGPIINRYWLIASGVLILWTLVGAARVSHAVGLLRPRQRAPGIPTSVDGVPVIVTNSLGPATVGFWRSRVIVPRWILALPESQREYVLRHEEEHRGAHDTQLLLLASLTLILVPWNLALWWQLRRLQLAVEVDCDNRVVTALGDANAYGGLLLKVAEAASRGPRLQPGFLGGMGSLEHRLTAMLAPPPLRGVHRYLLPAVACALLFVALAMPHPVLGGVSGSHVMPTTTATTSARGTHPVPEASVVKP